MSRLAWVFPGQGSQYPGMGKELYDQFPSARAVFEEADEVLGFSLSKLCFSGTAEELRQTAVTQPAILTVSTAALRVYRDEIGIEPAFAAGHSLGEYSALVSAGVFSFADALRIVEYRGTLMQQAAVAGMGAMCAVMGVDVELIERVCGELTKPSGQVVISNRNAPDQTVISGHHDAVELAAERLRMAGARTAALPVSAPFHSPLMADAAEELLARLQACPVHPPAWPVLSNVHGKPYTSEKEIASLLATQMTAPVRWDRTISYLVEQGVTAAIEFGPRSVLTNLMKANTTQIICMPMEQTKQLHAIREALTSQGNSGLKLAPGTSTIQQRFHPEVEPLVSAAQTSGAADSSSPSQSVASDPLNRERLLVVRCLAAAVTTRNRNWNEEEYRQGVIEPYRRLEAIQARLDQSGMDPSLDEMKEALQLLARIMRTKQVPDEEQKERLEEIVQHAGEWMEALRDGYRDAFEMKSGGDGHEAAINPSQSLRI